MSSEYYRDLILFARGRFSPARLKLKRAKHHLIELAEATDKLPLRRPYEHLVSLDREAQKVHITYRTEDRMPVEIAGVIGDVVHNLRSALDHVAVDLCCPPIGKGSRASKNIYFPVRRDRSTFLSAARDMRKEGAPHDAISLVEKLEPYGGGAYSILELHDLDVLDKHKLLIPATTYKTVNRMTVVFKGQPMEISSGFRPDEGGKTVSGVVDVPEGASIDDFDFGANFGATFLVVFGEGQPLAGKPIVPTLTQIAGGIERFIEMCEVSFLGQNPC